MIKISFSDLECVVFVSFYILCVIVTHLTVYDTAYDVCYVALLTLRLLMSYIYGAPILDVSRSHTTTQHIR